jgi:hypothetical protein
VSEPSLPEAAVEAVATNMMNRYESEYTLPPGATWRDWEAPAREDIAAALPHLLEMFHEDEAMASTILRAIGLGDMRVVGATEDGEAAITLTDQGRAKVEAGFGEAHA